MTKILVDLTEVESIEVPSGIHLKIEISTVQRLLLLGF